MTLRAALMAVSILMLGGGIGALVAGCHAWPLTVWGAIVFLALLFERWRYRASAVPASEAEIATGERFIDPETGAVKEVIYDEKTGERRYVDVSESRE
jgi:hypothetical protein